MPKTMDKKINKHQERAKELEEMLKTSPDDYELKAELKGIKFGAKEKEQEILKKLGKCLTYEDFLKVEGKLEKQIKGENTNVN